SLNYDPSPVAIPKLSLLMQTMKMNTTICERSESQRPCSARRQQHRLAACSKTSFSPREGTRPTRFLRKSACIAGPVPSPGAFFNGLLAFCSRDLVLLNSDELK